MANADFTAVTMPKLEALDTLAHAAAVAEFVQGITLAPGNGGGIHLNSGQVTGLYYVMQDLIDRINLAECLVGQLVEGQQHG